MDIYSKKKRSQIMSSIRSKDTSPEKEVFAYLRCKRIHFYKHYDRVAGKPDIAVPSKRRVVFIDGDFWHGWHFPKWSEKLSKFWRSKIVENIARDKRNFSRLRYNGWEVLRIWQHDLRGKKKEKTLKRIEQFILLAKKNR